MQLASVFLNMCYDTQTLLINLCFNNRQMCTKQQSVSGMFSFFYIFILSL